MSRPSGLQGRQLYDLAELYDIAYDWEVLPELDFYIQAMQAFGGRPVRRILEPACGTGRNLQVLAELGLKSIGYDINPATLDLARKRMQANGLMHYCELHEGDMARFRLRKQADGAFCSINSFRYLLEDKDVLSHLKAVRSMIKPGAVYILDFSYAMPPGTPCPDFRWTSRRDGTSIRVRWITKESLPERRSHETCRLDVRRADGSRESHSTEHTTRLWLEEEFLPLLEPAGFALRGVLGGDFEPLPDEQPLDGTLENLYHILQKV